MADDDHREPVLVRSRWGTNRYVFNPANGIGLTLIALTLLAVAGGWFLVKENSSWSERELRSAVEKAAASLEEKEHANDEFSDYSASIGEGIRRSGEGPRHSYDVRAVGDADRYEINADGVDTAFCMHVEQTESDEGIPVPGGKDGKGTVMPLHELSTTVDEGRC